MKSKILILSIYPAPYRMQVFEEIGKEFDTEVFFENAEGDERNKEWFSNQGAYVLSTEAGKQEYKKVCKRLKNYDLVMLYDYSTVIASKLLIQCKRLQVPYIINCDGVMLTAHGNKVKDFIKKFLIKGASGYLASGEYAKGYFLKYGANENKIHIHTFTSLREGDIQKEAPSDQQKVALRETMGLPSDGKIAIAVGRFIPLKRYDELIRAWGNMPKDLYLLLIGGGSELEKYQQTVKELGLDNVLLEPFHKKEELFDYYKASDIFVHPTSYDVWGLVVNEAMACGLPVVVSDHCIAGLELIRNGKNGYLVPMGAEDDLCKKAMEIMVNNQLRCEMGQCSIDTIKDYTIENMASTHIKVCKEIIDNSEKSHS